MRTTLSINDNLLKEAKKLSIERNCSLGEIVDDALRLSLAAQKKASSAQVSIQSFKTFKGTGVQSGIELSNSASLLDAMEQ